MNRLASILPAAQVLVQVEVTSKKRAFEEAGLLFESLHGLNRAMVADSLFARERLGSTGLGYGVAIPHGRIKGMKSPLAAVATSAYYASITGGRIAVGFVVDRWGNRRLVTLGVVVGIAGALMFPVASSVPLAVVALVLVGLGFAPVYPGLMHEVPRRFAPEAVQTIIGRQAGAGGVGAAILPAVAGAVAGSALELIPWMIVVTVVVLWLAIRKLDRIS